MKVWYIYIAGKVTGPHSKEDVASRISKGEVAPTDFLSLGVKDNWKLPTEWSCFPPSLFPAWQAVDDDLLTMDLPVWITLSYDPHNQRHLQSGPYSSRQIKNMLRNQQLTLQTFFWKEGMSGWVQIKHRPEFSVSGLKTFEDLSKQRRRWGLDR
jgi:hypothetical protein